VLTDLNSLGMSDPFDLVCSVWSMLETSAELKSLPNTDVPDPLTDYHDYCVDAHVSLPGRLCLGYNKRV